MYIINISDMQDLIFTPIAIPELVNLIANEIESRITRPEPTAPLPDRIGLNEVMNITGLKKSAVYKMTMAGSIPHGKYGRLLVFSRSEISQWMDLQIKRRPSLDETVTRHLKDTAKKILK